MEQIQCACDSKKGNRGCLEDNKSGLQAALAALQEKCGLSECRCTSAPGKSSKRMSFAEPPKSCPPKPSNVDASSMEIVLVRKICPDSLLVKWKPPACVEVTGYEIYVNDCLKSKVRSPNRTSCVLDTLELRKILNISIYAMTVHGKCQPPATAVFQPL